MKKEEIHIDDLKRILLGEAPFEFLAETFVRTVIVYFFLIFSVRLMGKRMGAQLSVLELAVVVMLGAIVSIPMQVPDRGILFGIFILGITFTLQRGVNFLSLKSARIEIITQGKVSLLLKDGILNLQEMNKASLSREILFANLRGEGIQHLGEVKRVYLEACGLFSIFRNEKTVPGLSVIPVKDPDLRQHLSFAHGYYACISCGYIKESQSIPEVACPYCNNRKWAEAIK